MRMTLTEFLLARIAEDKAEARTDFAHLDIGQKLEADCEAKRRIVEEHGPGTHVPYPPGTKVRYAHPCFQCNSFDGPCATLRHLGSVYTDHPDYCQEWAA